jgi:hypothetical protein
MTTLIFRSKTDLAFNGKCLIYCASIAVLIMSIAVDIVPYIYKLFSESRIQEKLLGRRLFVYILLRLSSSYPVSKRGFFGEMKLPESLLTS